MPRSEAFLRAPRWFWIPVRVVIITVLVTLISFAIALLLALLGLILSAKVRGISPNLTVAYHRIAFPAATLLGGIVLVLSTVVEVRHYCQAKALARLERIS
jgi:uncharacterized BrkB/YihY/UPF0761 family membrane protein